MHTLTQNWQLDRRQANTSAMKLAVVNKVCALVTMCLVLVTVLVGCAPSTNSRQEVEAPYGRQNPAVARKSVNGTVVFAEMYRQRGHEVDIWSKISPRMDEYDTVVWFPDHFADPDAEAQWAIRNWLDNVPRRTFVYVGRDFDGEEQYWRMMVASAQADGETTETIDEYRRRLAYVQSQVDARRRREDVMSPETEGESVSFSTALRIKDVEPQRITGEWAGVFDFSATDIVVYPKGNAEPLSEFASEDRDVLLAVDGVPLIIRYRVSNIYGSEASQLIYVQNGSFLLNLSLVNHEHRRLADAIVSESGSRDRVLFLESGPDGIEVIDHIDSARQPTPWDWVSIWPMNFIVPHLFVLAILFCVAYFPIFGRAKSETDNDHRSDFGEHLRALGALFAKTGQNQYMLDKIRLYEEQVRRESGTSHLK